MTEAEKSSVPSTETPVVRRSGPRRALFACALVVMLTLAAAWIACPWVLSVRAQRAAGGTTQIEERLAAVERQVDVLNGRLNDLGMHTDKNTEVTGKDASGPSAAAVVRMQSDLVTLSSAVGTLQAELKKASGIAAHVQQTAQSSLAAAMAFIQLRAAAEAGRGFAPELAALRAAVKSDAVFQEVTAKLEPYAATGAPTVESLHTEFLALESPAAVAIDKSAAQSWRDRLWAEMKGLVSVRPLHGTGTADAFTATEDALAAGDLGAALAASGNLPSGAQDTLKDWRVKAEARATVESAMHELSDHFIALAAPSASSPQDEP